MTKSGFARTGCACERLVITLGAVSHASSAIGQRRERLGEHPFIYEINTRV